MNNKTLCPSIFPILHLSVSSLLRFCLGKRLLILGLVLLSACNNSKTSQVNALAKNVIAIDPKSCDIKKGFMGQFIDTMIYIPLETNDSVICGQIERLYRYNHKFYIFDHSSDAIFIFDEKGKLVKKIENKGRGPQEYVRIDHYALDKNSGYSYIYCGRSQKILQYNEWGEFMKTIPCQFITSSFCVLSANTFLLYGGNFPNQTVFQKTYPQQDRLVIYHAPEQKYDPIGLKWKYDENYMTSGMDRNFFHCEDTISFIEKFGNYVYRFEPLNNHLLCQYYIDFGKYNLPYDFNTPSGQFKELVNSSKTKAKIFKILENKDVVYLTYSFSGLMFNALYYKARKQTLNIGPVWINEKDGVSMPEFHTVDEDYFIGTIGASILRSVAESPNNHLSKDLENLIAGIQETDNPCIVMVKFKKR